MGIQHDEAAPASFSDAFAGNYLGNPDTVSGLVGEFLANIEHEIVELMYGRLEKAEFAQEVNRRISEIAAIFGGRDPLYKTVMGYNEQTLGFKLMADLGEFWQKQRAKWNDDAVCVLFEWLTVILAEKVKIADGDDMLLEVMLRPSVEYTVSVLLGTEKRAD